MLITFTGKINIIMQDRLLLNGIGDKQEEKSLLLWCASARAEF